MPSDPDAAPQPWSASDALLAFTLAVATFLLVAIVVGGGLAGLVAAEIVGLGAVPIAVIGLRRLPPATIGLTLPSGRALVGGALVGLSLWYVGARLVEPWARLLGDDGASTRVIEELVASTPIAAIVLLSIVPAVCEEIACRGLAALGLVRRIGAPLAVLASAALFAALHLSLVRAVPTGLLGAALAVLAIRSGSLAPAMLAHALNNAIALLVGTGRLDPLAGVIEAQPDVTLAVALLVAGAGLGIAWRSART